MGHGAVAGASVVVEPGEKVLLAGEEGKQRLDQQLRQARFGGHVGGTPHQVTATLSLRLPSSSARDAWACVWCALVEGAGQVKFDFELSSCNLIPCHGVGGEST